MSTSDDDGIDDAIRETYGVGECGLFRLDREPCEPNPTVTVEYDPTCCDIPLDHLMTLTLYDYELELRVTLVSATRSDHKVQPPWADVPQWQIGRAHV